MTLADERARQQENTNFDLNRRASLRPYMINCRMRSKVMASGKLSRRREFLAGVASVVVLRPLSACLLVLRQAKIIAAPRNLGRQQSIAEVDGQPSIAEGDTFDPKLPRLASGIVSAVIR